MQEREMAFSLAERSAMIGVLSVTVKKGSMSVGTGTDCDPYVELTFDQEVAICV